METGSSVSRRDTQEGVPGPPGPGCMMPLENHYQLLGIEPSAPLPTIQSALARLADEANRLAYTSPDRSRELWERVRQIRADLLSSSARRQVYDASLQPSVAIAVATLERPQPASSFPRCVAPTPPIPSPAPAPSAGRANGSASRAVALWALVVAASIVALTLALALVLHRPASPGAVRFARHVLPVPSGLAAAGSRKGVGFVSGKRITLTWHPVRGAALYHLQLAASSDAGSGFQHPLLSMLTEGTIHSLKLLGKQRYEWRVQALVDGTWSPYTRAVFLVARPGTSAPQLHMPTATSIKGEQVRLCWSPVPWSVAYLLRIHPPPGGGQITVHGTCQTVTEKPGTYRWRVAGLLRGIQTYAGPFSQPEYFTVPAPRTAALQPVIGVTRARLCGSRPILAQAIIRDARRFRIAVRSIGRAEKIRVFRCDTISAV